MDATPSTGGEVTEEGKSDWNLTLSMEAVLTVWFLPSIRFTCSGSALIMSPFLCQKRN